MSGIIVVIFVFVFTIRILFLKKSKINERNILENGGVEYGRKVSRYLATLHGLFYLGCLIEGIIRKSQFDSMSMIGLGLLIFSMLILYYVVGILGEVWTIKLMVAKQHVYNHHWIFRIVKHPNYYLNIIPELIGLSLLCHAFVVSIVLFPIYLFVLVLRIKEENYVLRKLIKTIN